MVDLTSDIAASAETKSAAAFHGTIRCLIDRDAALDYVNYLSDDVICTGYQNPAFLRAWLAQENAKPLFIIFRKSGSGDVLLPLEIQDNGVATYCGGTHANGNFPVGRTEDIKALASLKTSDYIDIIADHAPETNVLFLERQHETWQGVKNPFVNEVSIQSANVALSFSLEGGFADVLERHHGKRKRKRQRNHARKLENFGAVHVEQHVSAAKVPAVLDAFFAMKAVRFKEAGICDVFADDAVKAMFRQMFIAGAGNTQEGHVLKAIMLDDVPISVIGCSVFDRRITVEFGAFDDRYSIGGPGDLLFYYAIEDACEKGLDIFDFGIGDEFYKRSWCDIETWHRDTIVAITTKGKIRSLIKTARNKAVYWIKSHDKIWSMTKALRKRFNWVRGC